MAGPALHSEAEIARPVQGTLWNLTAEVDGASAADPGAAAIEEGPALDDGAARLQSEPEIAARVQAPPPAATPAPARASLPSGEAVCSREADPSPSPAPAHLSWEDALERYHDHQQARRSSPRTIYSHRREILKLADALRGQVRGPADVTLDQLRRYQLALLKRRLTPATVANASGHLRTFFRFLHLEELLPEDPASRLERPKVPPRPPGEVLTTKEVQLLLQACEGSPTPLLARAVVETFYCTGIRRTELLDLDLTDVDHRQRTLLVRAGKGERPRVLPLAPACYEALSRYLDFGRPELERAPTQALFLSTRGDRLSKDSVARLLYELSDRAGLGRRATPHCFRRTCATGLLNNGTSLKVIQAILGHRSLETTSVYLCLSPEEIREAVLTHHPRERFEA